ncbi:hypothetical protein AC578_3085 [Pseudocercospora eumusae]|uniref:Uncharacterized protein n=1 Tax=Pseudocercospora eumusae TaxID=321146 RepID=A0A139H1S3_9PEZI|nr:hypothetical protein AC578_3085 [Pseudocercospora eumusae]
MGTLTAGLPRLDHYCEHKLPTSCRLTSIGECCACYDERAHVPYYSTYIDGIGFVPRGNRWQRYCWFCKEFWENRVNASGLRPAQTRIPEVPDQSEFLARWYEFHQGYRIIRNDDGSEERVAVLGEDLRHVDPGVLPRTLEEMRAGRERSELEDQERLQRQQRQGTNEEQSVDNGPSLDEALDEMYQAAEDEAREGEATRNTTNTANVHAQAMTSIGSRNREYQARRIAALRRELHRMRNGIERVISGLRDLGEEVPASSRLSELGRTLENIGETTTQEQTQQALSDINALTETPATTQSDRTLFNMQTRVDEARNHVNESRRNRDQAALELDAAEQDFRTSQSRLRQLQTEQRTTENYMRLFGTREEMQAQGDDYESPIGGMFSRAYERFRAAEEVRREERTLRQILEDEQRAGGEDVMTRLAELEARDRDVWGVPTSGAPSERPFPNTTLTQYTSPFASEPQGRFWRSRRERDQHGPDLGWEEYHALLQRQGLHQANDGPSTASTDQTTSDARNNRDQESGTAGQSSEQTNDDDTQDAVFILDKLCLTPELRAEISFGFDELQELLHKAQTGRLTELDKSNVDSLLQNSGTVWRSGLLTQRNRRQRLRGEHVTFREELSENNGLQDDSQVNINHGLELMAESFQMSSRVRGLSGLSDSEQIRMLNRLQSGQRSLEDRDILLYMYADDDILASVIPIHRQQYSSDAASLDSEWHTQIARLQRDRQDAARQGDHSRSELDEQRRATRTLALAAGRAAALTSPQALFEQMANRDAATRVAYERMQENGFRPAETMSTRRLRPLYRPLNLDDSTASPSATDSEGDEEEALGLDAKDTGRPDEALSDEQMTVKLDCQIPSLSMTAHSSSTSTRTALERLKLVERSLQSNLAESITADYLVIGAGAMAMAFVDTLLSETVDKKIIMLDRRARPGGHWVTAYPFVRLHQPAAYYGVNSRPLDSGQIDQVGWNKGLSELSSRDAVLAYFDLVMRQTFLPSGRVEFFPKHEYLGEGEFQSLLTKKSYKVGPETTIVDATYSRTSVPSMRPPPYEVAKGIDLVTPNGLPDITRGYANYTVVGAGKTAIDTCLWLLENDIKESQITWIMPRDSFFIERESLQPANRCPEKAQAHIQARMESTMTATSVEHYLQLQLDKKILHRLDENVWPTMYHCAILSLTELEAIRKIPNIVRKGRVTKITPEKVSLEQGSYLPDPETLYIDCSASALAKMPPVPIFRKKIHYPPTRPFLPTNLLRSFDRARRSHLPIIAPRKFQKFPL